jgi:hypothetical protein
VVTPSLLVTDQYSHAPLLVFEIRSFGEKRRGLFTQSLLQTLICIRIVLGTGLISVARRVPSSELAGLLDQLVSSVDLPRALFGDGAHALGQALGR